MDIKRGDIVWVEIPYAVGCEMMKDRPAVVVSNNAMNYTAQVVSVVYLTGSKQQADRPFHVEVESTTSVRHGSSVALCEHIYTVDKSRLGKIVGTCTGEEMDAIDNGILMSLALGDGKYKPGQSVRRTFYPATETEMPSEAEQKRRHERDLILDKYQEASVALTAAKAELEAYKRLYEDLLNRLVGGAA